MKRTLLKTLAACLVLCVGSTALAQTAHTPLNLSAAFNMDAIIGPAEYRVCLTDGGHDFLELFGDRAEGNGNYLVKQSYFIAANGYGKDLQYSIESTYGHPIYLSGDDALPADGVLTGADRVYHIASLTGNDTLAGNWTETADPSDYSLQPNCVHVGAYHNTADYQVASVTAELPAAQKGAYQNVNFIVLAYNGAHLARNMRIIALYGPDGSDEAELYAFTTDAGGDGPVGTEATEPGFQAVAAMTEWYSGPTGLTGQIRAGNSWLFEFETPLALDETKTLWGFRFEDVNPALNWAARGLSVFAATAARSAEGNVGPTANAGPDQSVMDSDEDGVEDIQLDGSASTDADGMIVTYRWSEAGTPIAVGATPLVSMTVATHTVDLTVTDDAGVTTSDSVVIDVTPVPPGAPIAEAGPNRTVADTDDTGDETVTLDGSASTDPDGTIASYVWTQGGTEIATGVTADVVLTVGDHDITLTVTDDEGRVRTDGVTITIAPYRAPVTYYVDGAAGDDTNDGSSATPFQTVQHAADQAGFGDTVIVRPGQYDEKVSVRTSGGEGARLTLRAEPSRQALVKGFTLSGDYISIEGFEITNAADDANGIFAGEAHRGTARTGCRMIDNYIHDVDGKGILAGEHALVKGNLMRNIGWGMLVNTGTLVEDNEIDGLMVKWVDNNGTLAVRKSKYAFWAGDDITFRGNYFHGTPMENMYQMGVCFFSSWDSWIWGSSHRILIENNIGFNATHASEPTAEAYRDSSHITYRNNLFGNTVFVGVLCKGWSNITVVNNTFINCGAYPIWFQTVRETQGSVARNNLIAYWNHTAAPGGYTGESGVANYALYSDPTATVDCDYNMFFGCLNRGYGEHDFTAEPKFVDPANGDFRQLPDSPGIDAGAALFAPPTDIEGIARPQGAGIDVGAYEYAPARKGGDANRDGTVDLNDFVILKTHFGSGTTWGEGDFDEDGDVDLNDFVILKTNFGT